MGQTHEAVGTTGAQRWRSENAGLFGEKALWLSVMCM